MFGGSFRLILMYGMTGCLGNGETRKQTYLVGGFNPFEKYLSNESNWIISPSRGESEKYLKPPPSCKMVAKDFKR